MAETGTPETKSFVEPGRFVVMLQGRRAGKKALVLAVYPEGVESRPYPHAYVLGVDKCPKKITKDMSQKAITSRTRVKTFFKCVNLNHILLTRHQTSDANLFKSIEAENLIQSANDATKKKEALEKAAAVLRQKYLNNKMMWLFMPLHF